MSDFSKASIAPALGAFVAPGRNLSMKACIKCGQEKPLEAFGKNRSRKDGLQAWCKACRAEHAAANRDQTAEYRAVWYAKNRDRVLARAAADYAANRDERLARATNYRAANIEKVRARNRAYHADKGRLRLADQYASGAVRYQAGERDALAHLVGKECGYAAAHQRVRRAYGRPSAHRCEGANCERMATAWALTTTRGPHIRTEAVQDGRKRSTRLVLYSLDPTHYRPLCTSCHTRLDAWGQDVFQEAA